MRSRVLRAQVLRCSILTSLRHAAATATPSSAKGSSRSSSNGDKTLRQSATSPPRPPPHVNALPRHRQIAQDYQYDWRAEAQRRGAIDHDITAALPDLSRSEQHRRRVAGWQPVVRLMGDQRLRVALVGRMNAGKSSLYNFICSCGSADGATAAAAPTTRRTVVKDFDGITRDAVEGYAELEGMPLTLIDTPGLVHGTVVEEALHTMETADVVLLVTAVDAAVSREEQELARYLCLKGVPTLLIVNKMDVVPTLYTGTHVRHHPPDDEHHHGSGNNADEDVEARVLADYGQSFALGDAIPVSTRRRVGLDMLAAALRPLYHVHAMRATQSDWDLEDAALAGDEAAMEEIRDRNCTDRPIRVAIVGRTNSGKSSLVNRLVGFERARAADEANTTRDALELACVYKGRKLQLIDTAGLSRKRYRTDRDFIARLHALSQHELRFAHVVVVVFDATEGHPNKYDMAVLHEVAAEGRPFVLCANKWDAVLDQSATAEAIDFKIKRQVREVKYANAVVVSAHTGLNLTLLLDHVLELYDTWNRRVRRADLTRFWRKMERSVVMPHHVARVGRIVQISARPPTFMLQLQTKKDETKLPRALQEMMKNALIEEFGLQGVPVRLVQTVRDSNPDYI